MPQTQELDLASGTLCGSHLAVRTHGETDSSIELDVTSSSTLLPACEKWYGSMRLHVSRAFGVMDLEL